MVEVLGLTALQRRGRRRPGRALAPVTGEGQGGEVAQHAVDVGMDVTPVEEGERDGQGVGPAPGGQDFRVQGEQDGGGGEAVPGRVPLDGLPVLGGQARPAPGEDGRVERRRVPGEGQGGGRRQFRQAGLPVGAGSRL